MSWYTHRYKNYSVVVPVDEEWQHDMVVWEKNGEYKSDCECGVKIIYGDHNPLIRHGSFDGREGVEFVKELLKK